MKAVLRGKLTALNAYIKKLEKSHTSELREHLKTLEQKEANSPKRSRWQKIIKLRAKVNKENNTKNQWDEELVGKNQQNTQTFIQTNQKAERKYSN